MMAIQPDTGAQFQEVLEVLEELNASIHRAANLAEKAKAYLTTETKTITTTTTTTTTESGSPDATDE